MIGTSLGPYLIVAKVGEGGMGEVYRARDTRLGRDVAIKVLPVEVAADPERRARFEREARAVAALDHPHICAIYDVGDAGGTHYLVMPLLDGQTLAARLEKGPLPLAQALTIAGQIADALDKAHRQGIVHRDLKPANVMLTKAGAGSIGSPQAKLLDFGLAKLRAPGGPVTLSAAGTAATAATGTAEGTILGTLHYMAPEQVEGKEADTRSDIWALGAVIYEMVTGVRPFSGDSAASVVGSILKDQPVRLLERQPLTPIALDRFVATCLEKGPDDRWQSVRDLARELQWIARGEAPRLRATGGWSRRMTAAATIVAALAGAIAATGVTWSMRQPAQARRTSPPRFLIYPEHGSTLVLAPATTPTPQVAVSPNGAFVAFVATDQGRPMIWFRALDEFRSRVLPGTEGAIAPFWSFDSDAIGFVAKGELKTVRVADGVAAVRAATSRDSRGATWGADGTIVAAMTSSGFLSLNSPQGTTTPLTVVDRAARDVNHRWPWLLEDGRHLVYAVRSGDPARRGIVLAAIGDKDGTRLVDTDWNGAVADNRLLYIRGKALVAQPLDLANRRVSGEPAVLVDSVGGSSTGYAAFGVSRTGVLAYAEPLRMDGDIAWAGRDGGRIGAPVAPLAGYVSLALSPDDQRLAHARVDPETNTPDIWIQDLSRGITQRLTSNRMTDSNPFWSADGSRIVFRSNRDGINRIFTRGVADTRDEAAILNEATLGDTSNLVVSDYSRDEKYLVLTNTGLATSFDVWLVETGASPRVRPLVQTEYDEYHGTLSPNGRWLAYVSTETGTPQVFMQTFPDAALRYQVSSRGGAEPQWRADGRELFFVAPDGQMMATPVTMDPAFMLGTPVPLFRTRFPAPSGPYRRQYAVSKDGQRFLMVSAPESVPPTAIHVVLDWRALLAAKP
jgi:eukaryotic-like serine/threonine-protein kinase